MDPKPANALFKVLAQKKRGWRAGFSAKLLPDPPDLWKAGLTKEHIAFFEGFGYEKLLVSPDTQISLGAKISRLGRLSFLPDATSHAAWGYCVSVSHQEEQYANIAFASTEKGL